MAPLLQGLPTEDADLMTPESARKRLLLYVVDRIGRPEAAKRLDTDLVSLDAWIAGTNEPPRRAVLALADLVYEMQKAGPGGC